MARELERLVLRIEADTKRLRGELKGAESAARQTGTRMSRAFNRASRAMAGLTRRIGGTRTALVALAGATALGFAIKKAIDFTEQIGKQADAIGISTDLLQKFRFAAQIASVSQDALDKSLRKASRTFGELGRSSSELDLALKDLAPTLLADLRAADSFEEQILLTLKALSEIEDQTQKNTIANTVFGRQGIILTNLVRDGNRAFLETLATAERLGLVIEESLIRSSEKAADQLTILAQVIKVNFTRGLLEGFLERSTDFAELVEDPRFAGSIRDLGSAITDFVQLIISNREEIGIAGLTLAGLFGGAAFGPIGAAAGAAGGLITGLVIFKTELLSTAGAAELLAEKVEQLAVLNERLAPGLFTPFREAAEETRKELLEDILELEIGIAATKRRDRETAQRQVEAEFRARVLPPLEEVTFGLPEKPAKTGAKVFFEEATKRRIALEREAARVIAATRTESEKFAVVQLRLNELFDAGLIGEETFIRAIRAAEEALNDTGDAGEEMFERLIEATEGFGRQFSRSMAELLITGQGTFKGLAQSFLVDFAEKVIQAQVTEPLLKIGTSFLQNLFLSPGPSLIGGGPSGRFVHGGRPPVGQLSLVGERGPEIFVPDVTGTIIPNSGLGGGGMASSQTQVVNQFFIDMRGASLEAMVRLEDLVRQVDGSIERRAVTAVATARSRGGAFSRSFGG